MMPTANKAIAAAIPTTAKTEPIGSPDTNTAVGPSAPPIIPMLELFIFVLLFK